MRALLPPPPPPVALGWPRTCRPSCSSCLPAGHFSSCFAGRQLPFAPTTSLGPHLTLGAGGGSGLTASGLSAWESGTHLLLLLRCSFFLQSGFGSGLLSLTHCCFCLSQCLLFAAVPWEGLRAGTRDEVRQALLLLLVPMLVVAAIPRERLRARAGDEVRHALLQLLVPMTVEATVSRERTRARARERSRSGEGPGPNGTHWPNLFMWVPNRHGARHLPFGPRNQLGGHLGTHWPKLLGSVPAGQKQTAAGKLDHAGRTIVRRHATALVVEEAGRAGAIAAAELKQPGRAAIGHALVVVEERTARAKLRRRHALAPVAHEACAGSSDRCRRRSCRPCRAGRSRTITHCRPGRPSPAGR